MNVNHDDEISALWQKFAEDVRYLWQKPIPILEHPPDPLTFCRDYVQASRPCIIQNAILDDSGNPLHLTLEDILSKLGPGKILTVDATPDGQGDAVRTTENGEEIFVQPQERQMSLEQFLKHLRQTKTKKQSRAAKDMYGRPVVRLHTSNSGTNSGSCSSLVLPDDFVVYYSRQNDCLRQEVPSLQNLFPPGIEWAREAFGTDLDAVNLWMGNESAVSSMHKDHYENLFYVASGEKIFTLCPPSDVAFLYEHLEFPKGIFEVNDAGKWGVKRMLETEEDPIIRWIAPDVSRTRTTVLGERFPRLQYTHSVQVHIQQGELLYLPSLWFHRVTQSCETIGVNYWYDMKFDSPLWCYFSFLQQLAANKNKEEGDGTKNHKSYFKGFERSVEFEKLWHRLVKLERWKELAIRPSAEECDPEDVFLLEKHPVNLQMLQERCVHVRCEMNKHLPPIQQTALEDHLHAEPSTIPDAGLGLFYKPSSTFEIIPKGTTLCYYTGFIHNFQSTKSISDKRYLMAVKGEILVDPSSVDPGPLKNIIKARYINDPLNEEAVNCRYDPEEVRSAVVATRDILPGEELFLSYGDAYWSSQTTAGRVLSQ